MFINLFTGQAIGLLVGFLEIKMAKSYEKDSAMLNAVMIHWGGVGALIPFVDFGLNFWITGIIVSLLTTLPFLIMNIGKSRNAVIHTVVFIPIWGVTIAYLCSALAVY